MKIYPDFSSVAWRTRVVPEDYERNLLMIAAEARKRNIKVIFVKSCLRHEIEMGSEDLAYTPPQPFINVYQIFSSRIFGQPGKFFVDEKHYTELGHQLLANSLCKELMMLSPSSG